MKRKTVLKLILALFLAAGILFLCFRQVDLVQVWSDIRGAALLPLLLAGCFSILVIVANTYQFRLLLPESYRISRRRLFEVVSVFSMGVNLLPFGGGQALLVYLLGHRERAGKTVTLSVLTLEQISDGFSKILLFLIVSLFAPLPTWIKAGMQGVILVISVLYVFLFLVAHYYPRYAKIFENNGSRRWGAIKKVILNWAKNLHALRSWRKTLGMVLMAVLMKLCQVLSVYCVQWSMGLSLGISEALFVVVAISLATSLPVTPGRLGLVESAALLTYGYLGIGADKGLALGLLIHVAQLVPYLIAGYLCSVKLGLRKNPVTELDEVSTLPPRGIA